MIDHSIEEKAELYSAAVIEALAIAGAAMGKPDINAAIGALTSAQAYLIAKIEDRNLRRLCEKQTTDSLGRLIALRVQERIEQAEIGFNG